MQFSSCGKGNWNNSKLGWKWFEFKLFFFLWKLFLFFFIFRDLLRSGSSLTILINLDFSNRLKGKGFELFVSGVDTLDFAWSRVWKWRQDYAHQIVKWKWLFHSSLFSSQNEFQTWVCFEVSTLLNFPREKACFAEYLGRFVSGPFTGLILKSAEFLLVLQF